MTPESVGPLSRPVSVEHLPEGGLEVVVEATPEERAALAKDFKLPAIHALEGRFRLTGTPRRVRVAGLVRARVEQSHAMRRSVSAETRRPSSSTAPTLPSAILSSRTCTTTSAVGFGIADPGS